MWSAWLRSRPVAHAPPCKRVFLVPCASLCLAGRHRLVPLGCALLPLPSPPSPPPAPLLQCYIINPPLAFRGVWALVRPMLDEKTRNKIKARRCSTLLRLALRLLAARPPLSRRAPAPLSALVS